MNMIGIFFLSLSLVLGSTVAAQTAEVTGNSTIEQGAVLPPKAMQAAEAMIVKGSGGFSVGIGVRDKVISLTNFGDIKADTQYPIASASKFLTAATVMSVVEAATGRRWTQVFQEKIAAPLGMSHTYWTHLRLDSAMELSLAETLNPVLQGGAVSTATDYLRFLSMMANEGVFEGKRVLSKNSVDEMLKDQTPKAFMTPAPENPIKGGHYSLGNWCESWDEAGACLRSSSIGAFGVYPWVERKTGSFGIVFVYQRENAFRLWPEIKAIRDAVEVDSP